MILVTSGAARSDGFTRYAAFPGPSYGGCPGGCPMGMSSNGRIFTGAEMILPGVRNTLSTWGTVISSPLPR